MKKPRSLTCRDGCHGLGGHGVEDGGGVRAAEMIVMVLKLQATPRSPVVVELAPDCLPHGAPRQHGQPAQPSLQRGLDHVPHLNTIKQNKAV